MARSLCGLHRGNRGVKILDIHSLEDYRNLAFTVIWQNWSEFVDPLQNNKKLVFFLEAIYLQTDIESRSEKHIVSCLSMLSPRC